MSDEYFCSTCGARYLPGESNYCGKCGAVIKVQDISQDIKRIQREPKPYEALRFTSGLIIFLGWVIIIGGWFVAFTIGAVVSDTIASALVSDGASVTLLKNMSMMISFSIGMFTTIQGLFMIALGQVFMALLDVRNDTHITMKMIARFGMAMIESKKEPPAVSQ